MVGGLWRGLTMARLLIVAPLVLILSGCGYACQDRSSPPTSTCKAGSARGGGRHNEAGNSSVGGS
jgi:hypothetical protein